MRLKWKNILGLLVMLTVVIVAIRSWDTLRDGLEQPRRNGSGGDGVDFNVAMAAVTVGIIVVALAARRWKRGGGRGRSD